MSTEETEFLREEIKKSQKLQQAHKLIYEKLLTRLSQGTSGRRCFCCIFGSCKIDLDLDFSLEIEDKIYIDFGGEL